MKVVNEKYKDKYLKYKNKYYNIKKNNYKQKGGDMLFYISSLSIVGIILWFIFKNPKKDTSDLKKIEREINKNFKHNTNLKSQKETILNKIKKWF